MAAHAGSAAAHTDPAPGGDAGLVRRLLNDGNGAYDAAEGLHQEISEAAAATRRAVVQERAALHAVEQRVIALQSELDKLGAGAAAGDPGADPSTIAAGIDAEEAAPPGPHDAAWRSHWILGRAMRMPSRADLRGTEKLPSPGTDPQLAGLPHAEILYATRCLLEHNFCVLDDFWPAEACRRIRREVDDEWNGGGLKHGQLGKGALASGGDGATTLRSDLISWHEGGDPGTDAATEYLHERADVFVQKLAVLLGTVTDERWEATQRTKMMFAMYPGDGTHYVKHYDNPNQNGRKLSMLLYLNDGWRPEHGGVLRIGREAVEHPARPYRDVAPLMGRMVVFWSDRRCPHEVSPAFTPRAAITIWYLDPDERRRARDGEPAGDGVTAV